VVPVASLFRGIKAKFRTVHYTTLQSTASGNEGLGRDGWEEAGGLVVGEPVAA